MKIVRTRFSKFLSLIEAPRKSKAALFDVTEPTIYNWITNKNNPNLEAVERLAKIFGISINVFNEATKPESFEEILRESSSVTEKEASSRLSQRIFPIHANFAQQDQRRMQPFEGNFWLYRRSIKNPNDNVAKSAFKIFKNSKGIYNFYEERKLYSKIKKPLTPMKMEGDVIITSDRTIIFSGYTYSLNEKKPKYMISNFEVRDPDCFSVLLTAPAMGHDKAFSCPCLVLRHSGESFETMTMSADVIEAKRAEHELERFNLRLPGPESFVVLE